METEPTTIEETAVKIIQEAKRGTRTYGEALNNLSIASFAVCSGAYWVEAYELAMAELLQEMRDQPHNYGKPFD